MPAEEHNTMEFGGDRISNLPGNVIDQILSCLPIRDAARTTVLSPHWRHYWSSIPSLNFSSYHFNRSWNGDHPHETVIYQTLMFHAGSIRKFILRCPDSVSDEAIACWIKFLSSNHARDLQVLELHRKLWKEAPFEMPSPFFSFGNLTRLCLSNFGFKTPPGFKGFNRIVSLDLNRIQIECEELNRFLAGCPELEFLKISSCMNNPQGHLTIYAPKLKCFKYADRYFPIYLDAVGLEELSIDYRNFDPVHAKVVWRSGRVEGGGNLIAAFGHLPSVTMLELDGYSFDFLSMFSIPTDPFKLKSLTVIKIWNWGDLFERKNFVHCVISLIRSSPNLQRLEITVVDPNSGDRPHEPAIVEYLKAQQECKGLLPCLKTVVLRFFSGSKSEMEFVRLIFLWANVLEKLVLLWAVHQDRNDSFEKVTRMLKEFTGFRQASSKAEIVFY